mmetsp:Transcript_8751/g.29199  ORF Transcript_8751/g.29199 Transcript_8751/m.29199 type:complete len:221 (-) Transcript_8751:1-663(-)
MVKISSYSYSWTGSNVSPDVTAKEEAPDKLEPKLEKLHGTMLQEFLILQAKRAQAETEQVKRALAVAEKDRNRLYQENNELLVQLESTREELGDLQQKYSNLREWAAIMYANLLKEEVEDARQSREFSCSCSPMSLTTSRRRQRGHARADEAVGHKQQSGAVGGGGACERTMGRNFTGITCRGAAVSPCRLVSGIARGGGGGGGRGSEDVGGQGSQLGVG